MLSQQEADKLRAMPKRLVQPESMAVPPAGDSLVYELESMDTRHKFLMDANRRGKIVLNRCTYQERYRIVELLARLDIGGPPHRNPRVGKAPLDYLEEYNGAQVRCPHLHVYVEGYEDKWAVPASSGDFPLTDDLTQTLRDFMRYCGVVEIPDIQSELI